MIILLRMLMVILLLGSLAPPAAFAMPLPSEAAEQLVMAEHMADNEHACCPSEADPSSLQSTHQPTTNHVDCDNSCNDCQHFCHASSAGLLTASRYVQTNPDSERSQLLAAAPHYSTTPLDRPPHRH